MKHSVENELNQWVNRLEVFNWSGIKTVDEKRIIFENELQEIQYNDYKLKKMLGSDKMIDAMWRIITEGKTYDEVFWYLKSNKDIFEHWGLTDKLRIKFIEYKKNHNEQN